MTASRGGVMEDLMKQVQKTITGIVDAWEKSLKQKDARIKELEEELENANRIINCISRDDLKVIQDYLKAKYKGE